MIFRRLILILPALIGCSDKSPVTREAGVESSADAPATDREVAMSSTKSRLDHAVDFALAEVERVGDVSRLPPPVKIVAMISSAQGVIDNGGLQYFFESDWPDQPPYSTFVNAYRAIGADALADAVKLFPFRDPHKHQDRRNKLLEECRFPNSAQHRPDSPFEPYSNFLCGNKTVWQKLETYASANAPFFRRNPSRPNEQE